MIVPVGMDEKGKEMKSRFALVSLLHHTEKSHHKNARHHGEDLAEGLGEARFLMQFGNEVGACDVEEVPGGEGEETFGEVRPLRSAEEHEPCAEERDGTGEEVEEERVPAREAAVNENREVPDLLGDFVKDHGQGRREPERNTYEETCGDHRAIDEVVDAVADEAEETRRVIVLVFERFPREHVAMPPMDHLLNSEGEDDTPEQDRKALREFLLLLRHLRNHVKENGAEHSPGREADDRKDGATQGILVEREEEDSYERDKAHGEHAAEREENGIHKAVSAYGTGWSVSVSRRRRPTERGKRRPPTLSSPCSRDHLID